MRLTSCCATLIATLPWLMVTSFVDAGSDSAKQQATGIVFEDVNANRVYDAGEPTLSGIRVSNGLEIATTDQNGRYELPVDDDTILFVIKPSGYRTPLSDNNLPQFYYIHKPKGSPDTRFAGVEPTGPLPASVDFPLYKQAEPKQFKAIMFGDPQPRNQQEVDWISHDVIEELVGTDASLGVTLGDIAFDNLDTFEQLNRSIALLGIPWYNVIGNHDLNFEATQRKLANETYERVYGPSYYSFEYGVVHFVVVDNIEWIRKSADTRGTYRGGLGPEQLQFIENDLKLVPDDQLVVLMMHIPLTGMYDRQNLYRVIENRKYCISISGHTHHHEHVWIDGKDGWKGQQPHHHMINVTVCGSWWSGALDERGIPHSTMADGAPNGYSLLSFDCVDYKLDFKAAGRDANYQMEIDAPEVIKRDEQTDAEPLLYVNFFNGDDKSSVEMQIGAGEWVPLEKSREEDPKFRRTFMKEGKTLAVEKPAPFRKLPNPKPSSHLWKVSLPTDLPVGTHLIKIKATDQWKRTYDAERVIRVQ